MLILYHGVDTEAGVGERLHVGGWRCWGCAGQRQLTEKHIERAHCSPIRLIGQRRDGCHFQSDGNSCSKCFSPLNKTVVYQSHVIVRLYCRIKWGLTKYKRFKHSWNLWCWKGKPMQNFKNKTAVPKESTWSWLWNPRDHSRAHNYVHFFTAEKVDSLLNTICGLHISSLKPIPDIAKIVSMFIHSVSNKDWFLKSCKSRH